MNLDLVQFGITLAIGCLLLIVIDLALRCASGHGLAAWTRRSGWRLKGATASTLLAVGVFGLGIFIETVSTTISFGEKLPWLMPPEKVGVFEVLFAPCRTCTDPGESPIRKLGADLAAVRAFERFGGPEGPRVNEIVSRASAGELYEAQSGLPTKSTRLAAQALFYNAKNRVYREATYFQELQDIRHRIVFSRAVTLLSALFLASWVSIVVFKFLRRPGTRSLWAKPKAQPSSRLAASRVILVAAPLVMLGVLGLSMHACKTEENEFNSRAFGYFRTLLLEPAR